MLDERGWDGMRWDEIVGLIQIVVELFRKCYSIGHTICIEGGRGLAR